MNPEVETKNDSYVEAWRLEEEGHDETYSVAVNLAFREVDVKIDRYHPIGRLVGEQTLAFSFDEWDAIVAAVAEARKAGGR
jgi:hypothetical protein